MLSNSTMLKTSAMIIAALVSFGNTNNDTADNYITKTAQVPENVYASQYIDYYEFLETRTGELQMFTDLTEAQNTLNRNILKSKAETISVSSVKVTWEREPGHCYDISCEGIGNAAEYNYNIRISYKDDGCYITGLRENSEYIVTIDDVTSHDVSERLMARTETVTVLEEYEYIPGWTNCFTYESASGLTHDPSKAAIQDAIVDPVTNTGIMRDEYGDYCVAMGLYYGRCGDRFLVELENGVQFTVKICDSKGWADDGEGKYHYFGWSQEGKNIIEFIHGPNLPYEVSLSGNYGDFNWDGLMFDNIKSIKRIAYGETISY